LTNHSKERKNNCQLSLANSLTALRFICAMGFRYVISGCIQQTKGLFASQCPNVLLFAHSIIYVT